VNCKYCEEHCSCHLTPPCSFCVTHIECDVCGGIVCKNEAIELMGSDGDKIYICPECELED
jgi:hypothetical protein